MAGFIESLNETFQYIHHDLADPRTKNWWGVYNPLIILSIVSCYLYFCQLLGPRLMKDRRPFQLKNVLLVYNFLQVLLSLYLTYLGTIIIFAKEYSIACEKIDYSDNPRAMLIAGGIWWYFFAKVTELLDTVFFVLRKKYNQVSFLHVYHHTIMAITTWFAVKYAAGGHAIMMGYLNSIVHVVMYTYYLISGLGPEYQKYIWWKKHVTLIQLIQFCIIFVHNFATFFYDCSYPKTFNVLLCVNATAFMYMFGKFYIKNYNREKKNVAPSKKDTPSLAEKVRQSEARHRNTAEKTR